MVVFTYCDLCLFFFFKQKTAYEMRISDWSSDVCSSDLTLRSLLRSIYSQVERWLRNEVSPFVWTCPGHNALLLLSSVLRAGCCPLVRLRPLSTTAYAQLHLYCGHLF